MYSDARQQILEMFPLVSYEEERTRSGSMTFVAETEKICPIEGLSCLTRLYKRGNGSAVWVYLAILSPTAKAQLAVSACPKHTIRQVREHAQQFDGKVIFAANASFFRFFNNGDLSPHGIQIVRGDVLSLPGQSEKPQFCTNFIGVDKDGKPLIADAEAYFSHLQGKLDYAVGGGLILIRSGKICLHKDDSLAPRTAAGIARDGTLILLCADGRSSRSAGLSYADMIDIYTHLGYDIADLLNMDGGGSTAALIREQDGSFRMLNVPSGPPAPNMRAVEPHGEEQARPVADALLIIEK